MIRDRIIKYLHQNNQTKIWLADTANVDYELVKMYLNGQRDPGVSKVEKLLTALNIKI